MKSDQSWRMLRRDGMLNIAPTKQKRLTFNDIYFRTLSASWPRFFFNSLILYLTINCLFAAAYFLCGSDALEGVHSQGFRHLVDCFFFSVQTLATIGYGKINPTGLSTNLLVTFEALIGLMSQAIMTGLMYSRFARPTARVVFSEKAVVQNLDGVPSLVFRIANARLNQILETKIRVSLLIDEVTTEGEKYRNFYDLKLERDFSPMFALSFTVVHPIDNSSPLFGKTAEDWATQRVEIFASLNGLDEHLLQTIHARFSYTLDDIRWNHRFEDILSRDPDGKVKIDIAHLHDVTALPA